MTKLTRRDLVTRIAALERENARLTFIIHHTHLAEVGIHSPDQTDKSCIGINTHKLKLAKQLAKLGVVTVENSPNGPLVSLTAPISAALTETPRHE